MIPTRTRLQYANGYLDLGMTKEAALELEAIDDKDRLEAEVKAMRIRLHLGRRRWKLMVNESQQLTEIDPENPFGWVNWAYALREQNRIKEAKAIAEKSLEIHPKEAVLWFNLACYCSLLGETEEASKHLDKAISLEKLFEAEAVDDPDLENLWKWIRSNENES